MTTLREIVARGLPEISNEIKDLCETWFKTTRQEFGSSCNYLLVSPCGSTKSETKRPCHGSIQHRAGMKGSTLCVATDTGQDRRQEWHKHFSSQMRLPQDVNWRLDWSVMEPFLKWFLYESYFSPFILNRDDFEFVKSNGIIVSADVPAALLQNIMIASRYFVECSPYSFHMFNALTAKGIDPRIAYTTCFCTGASSYIFIQDPDVTQVTGYTSHRTTPLLSLEGIRNFLRDDFGEQSTDVLSVDKNYRTYSVYQGGSRFFGPGTNGGFVKELLLQESSLRNALSVYRKEKNAATLYKPPNPFETPRATREIMGALEFSYTEMYECLIPFISANNLIFKGQENHD